MTLVKLACMSSPLLSLADIIVTGKLNITADKEN